MAGYQYTIIIGNVGRDPEMKYTQAGVAVCDFSVAVSKSWTDKTTNEKREKTTWFRVTAWRGLAETVNTYVHKGMQIMVTGEVNVSAYTGNDGEAKASLELTANDIQFLSRKGENGGSGNGGYSGPPADEDDPLPF